MPPQASSRRSPRGGRITMVRLAKRPLVFFGSAVTLALLAGCQPAAQAPAPKDEGRLLGAVQANVSSFVLTPDGCGLSASFDDFDFPARSAPTGSAARKHERWIAL